MGTRSTYRIISKYRDEKGKTVQEPLVLVYMQYDGYPKGHPLQTAQWLAKGQVVNGYSMPKENEEPPLVFNGAGCLAAQFIAMHKDGVGGTYIHTLASRGKSWEDYLYDIIIDEDTKEIEFVCYENDGGRSPLFKGSPKDFAKKYAVEEPA